MNFIKHLRRGLCLLLVASVAAAQAPASTISPLLQGVLAEDIAAVGAALDAGANPNTIDAQLKHAALHVAVAPGGPRNPDVVELLGKRGANLNLEDPELRLTPLMTAMVVKDYSPFGVVERARSNVLVEQLLRLGAGPDSAVDGGVTPLMFAAATNNLPAMRLLLAKGAKPNLQNAQGATALHAAYPPGGSAQAIALLQSAGANPDIRDEKGLKPGELPPAPAPAPAPAPVAAQVAVPATKVEVKPVAGPATPTAAVEPAKSGWNKWLVGGAVVAATIVGAVVLDAYVKDQEGKKQRPMPMPAPTPPRSATPIVTPTPPPISSPTTVIRISDMGYMAPRPMGWEANILRRDKFSGMATPTSVVWTDRGNTIVFYVDVVDPSNQGFTVQFESSAPELLPAPLPIVYPPSTPACGDSAKNLALCATRNVTAGIAVRSVPLSLGKVEVVITASVAGSVKKTSVWLINERGDPGAIPIKPDPAPPPVIPAPIVLPPPVLPSPIAPPLVCKLPQVLQNGVCVTPPPVCTSPKVLQNGVCVTPLPVCVAPQVLQGVVCVTPLPVCTSPQVLQNGVCVTPLPVCVQPQVLQGNVCVTPPPVCTSPQVLQGNVCVTPPPVCTSTQVLQNGVCITPVISPENISANPVDFESLLRTIFNDGPNMATISWNPPAGAVVTDVALMFNWACQAGQFQKTIHAIPVPGSKSALVDFTGAGNNGTAIPCPENGVPMSKVAPVSAGIRLTYKANGVGPDLYVVKPYGQAPCRLYYPSTIQFPMVFVITETWRNAGNSGQYNHTIPNPINYAEWMGMASRMVFKSCNGQFASATATKYVPPTATESQAFNRVVEASNGLITYTFRATRTGSTVDEDTTFVFQYRIATGDYTFTTAGGQRVLVNGNTSTVAGNRSGKVVVSVGGAIP